MLYWRAHLLYKNQGGIRMKSHCFTDIKPVRAGVIVFVVTLMLIFLPEALEANHVNRKTQSAFLKSLKTVAPVASVRVKNVYPHDAGAFTQGLFFYQGHFYESTGLYGKSVLARKDIQTGKTLREIRLPDKYFGEGIALLKGKIYQLTWRERTVFVYEADSLKRTDQFACPGEGWGLTTDGRHLLMSDGSSAITFRDPDTFAVIRAITVHDGDTPVGGLNELEYIAGEIWAVVFMQDVIARISPADGRVASWVDLSSLRRLIQPHVQADVLNGIAYDAKTGRVFVTGKFWPQLFEIQLVPAGSAKP